MAVASVLRPAVAKRGVAKRAVTADAVAAAVILTAASLCLHGVAAAQPSASAGGFDLEILKSRGLNPAIASHFQDVAQFMPGTHTVTLSVNGRQVGRAQALFDSQGKLCLTPDLLKLADLNVPDIPDSVAPSCPDNFLRAWPATTIALHPERMAVDIVAPPGAINRSSQRTLYQSGGRAAILNYDVLSSQTHHLGNANRYLQAYTEVGLNANDWILRSNSAYSSLGGRSTWNHIDAYAQRTFASRHTTFQIGQINLQGALFGGMPVTGMQVFPESALQLQRQEGTPISGIAHTQARVDVWQNGIPLASTIVPPGPFTLTDVVARSLNQDIKVVIHEASGETREFTVPAAALYVDRLGAPAGFSGGLGVLRHEGQAGGSTEPVASAEYGIALSERSNLTAGLVLSRDFRAIGARTDLILPGSVQTGLQSQWSQNVHTGRSGAQYLLSGSAMLLPRLSANVSLLRRTDGYSDIQNASYARARHDSLHDEPWGDRYRYRNDYIKQQLSAGLGWSHAWAGGFSASFSESVNARGNATRRGMLNWGKSFHRASLSVSLERDVGSSHRNQGSFLYVNLSMPIGKQSFSASMQRQDDGSTYGLSTSAAINENANYSLNVTTSTNGRPSYSGSVGLDSAYTQLNVAASSFSGGYSQAVRARGAVVGHAQGVSFSPYRVQDTFAIASVGDLSGVRLSTPAGSVWTDAWGRAVIPSVPAYRNGQIQVATSSLARNVDLINGRSNLEPARGSVSAIDFTVVKVRRALLTATYPDGTAVPKGAAVLAADDSFITLVGSGGQIFLPDLQSPDAAITVAPADSAPCALRFDLPASADLNQHYERAAATCEPVTDIDSASSGAKEKS